MCGENTTERMLREVAGVKVFAAMCMFLLAVGIIERIRHARRLSSIHLRVQVNGTRGKSTTTRLIAAGLRAGGMRVIAKTTGTAARLIYEDGSEEEVSRRANRSSIAEQMRTIALAAKRGADVVVVECMALEPENQWVAEHVMVKSHIGVITNARSDHLEIMGPDVLGVAQSLSNTVPRRGQLVTSERTHLGVLQKAASRLGTEVHYVDGSKLSDDCMSRFAYVGFKENVACALRVCELAGIDPDIALAAMIQAAPDPGAMTVKAMNVNGSRYVLANAFAANDKDSTWQIWSQLERDYEVESTADGALSASLGLPVAVVMNNRPDRSVRLGELVPLAAQISPARVFLIGRSGAMAARRLQRAGYDACRVRDLTATSDPVRIMQLIADELPGGALLFAMGNTMGAGSALSEFFERNGESA